MHAASDDAAPLSVTDPTDRRSDAGPAADVARSLAFSRSLRSSRARRATAALRRRRLLRGRGAALLATAGLVVISGGALAQQQRSSSPQSASTVIVAAQRALGIAADGVVGRQTRRATRRFQRAHGLAVDGIIGPQTLKALGIGPAGAGIGASAQASSGGSRLERIAACESGGDPTAVSAGGRYRGKYQFDRATWRRMGGTGDPATAPEAEQDARAAKLLEQVGASPWPNCA